MNYVKDVLVTTNWVEENRKNIKLIEVNEDILLYDLGHIEGALKLDWQKDLWHPIERDFIDEQEVSQLLGRLGINENDTIVLYGDKSNWWASYAYWFLSYSGVKNLKIMNGGRQKWIEENRKIVTEYPEVIPTNYPTLQRNNSLRAYRDEVKEHLTKVKNGIGGLVDVRSVDEFSGKITHMENYPQEGVLRGGHIPNAKNIPWSITVNPDGTFKSKEELEKIYLDNEITPDKEIIAYCRIAERSSHTWFVLSELLGYPKVKNYDGSWTEWGNTVGMPINKTYKE